MGTLGWRYLRARDKEAIARGVRSGEVFGGPYHLEIHPADRCNIDCFFCSTAAMRGTDELPQARFEELLAEAARVGTRSIRFAGGGEPLFHRQIEPVLQTVVDLGLRIENVTTNAVLLRSRVAELLVKTCDEVTVSLNTIGAASYAKTMQTTERNYDRILENVRNLRSARGRQSTPRITIQFLVWRENFERVHEMYALARSLGADEILFNGLSGLPPADWMTVEERARLLDLYEQLVREDELRYIRNIASYEYDIKPDIDAVIRRLGDQRGAARPLQKIARFLKRDGSLAGKVRHSVRMRLRRLRERHIDEFDDACIIGWYSMVIRSNGDVGPCCILQGKRLGNVMSASIDEVWRGDAFRTFRRELSRIRQERHAWALDGSERIVDAGCALSGTCPMRSYYYRSDTPFARAIIG